MPEGDTLHKVAAFMHGRMVDTVCVEAHAAQSRLPILHHRRITGVRAIGKHLLIDLVPDDPALGPEARADSVWHLRVHLGMHGSWHAYNAKEAWQRPRWQASVVLATSAEDVFVCFNADDVELIAADALHTKSPVAHLGPNLLGERCDMLDVVRRARRRPTDTPLVDTLLDQSVAAGLGNVYKSELLYLFGLHPMTHVQFVDDATLRAIFERGRLLLQRNLGGWPRTTTYDRSRNPTGRGVSGPRLYVYRRKSEPCLHCSAPIERALMGRNQRSTYFCPVCQRHAPRANTI